MYPRTAAYADECPNKVYKLKFLQRTNICGDSFLCEFALAALPFYHPVVDFCVKKFSRGCFLSVKYIQENNCSPGSGNWSQNHNTELWIDENCLNYMSHFVKPKPIFTNRRNQMHFHKNIFKFDNMLFVHYYIKIVINWS